MPNANAGIASIALIVSDTAGAFDAIAGAEVDMFGAAFVLPVSVAVIVMLSGLAVTSAIVGIPESMQFAPLNETVSPVPPGNPAATQFVSGRIPPVVGIVAVYIAPCSPVVRTNAGTASPVWMVSETAAAFDAIAGGVFVATSPESVAVIVMLIGLAVTSAAVGCPVNMQFAPLNEAVSPVPPGNPATAQCVSGGIPPVVGIVAV